ncbi:MAG: hypothetical protein M1830_008966 [Pleopsidium flavum]|nr:MAG: hypothetical protein M1830_008966 [Pleopsidium flavum]
MDPPSVQLQADLQHSVLRAFSTQRPVLTHLNADTTWLLQLPYPKGALPASGRTHFNILIDPWLQGPQSDIASWFSKQWHAIDSSVRTIAELEDRLRDVQDITYILGVSQMKSRKRFSHGVSTRSYIDVVVISHEFTDHCHKETLQQINRAVPVLATAKAADIVRSWNHFALVQETPPFRGNYSDWRSTSFWPLPDWLGISRMISETDALYFHSAILIFFNVAAETTSGTLEEDAGKAIIYSPHGIHADHVSHLPSAIPPIKTLALLHGLHDINISFTKQLNLGAHNGLRVQRLLKAKYWVGTHDEVKRSGGILAPFLRREVLTLQKALNKEKKERGFVADQSDLADMRDVRFAALRSGQSLLLE